MAHPQWFDPSFSLETEASLAISQQKMRQLTHQQLQAEAEGWIRIIYNQQQIINCCARWIQELEISIALGQVKSMDHLAMARELNPGEDEAEAPAGGQSERGRAPWPWLVAGVGAVAAALAALPPAPHEAPAAPPAGRWPSAPMARHGGPTTR